MPFIKSITFDDEELRRTATAAQAFDDSAPDDVLFIDKLRAGERDAFGYLIDRYSGDIYALLCRITGDTEEAADLTQDTFVRALRSMKSFRGDSEIKTWLFRIAINESRNRFRWWKRRKRDLTISLDATIGDSETLISDTLSDNSKSPEDAALERERESALKIALLDLPQVFREAVVLCDIEGLSYEETALALGIGIGTVKSRISRGREELRRRLKDL